MLRNECWLFPPFLYKVWGASSFWMKVQSVLIFVEVVCQTAQEHSYVPIGKKKKKWKKEMDNSELFCLTPGFYNLS